MSSKHIHIHVGRTKDGPREAERTVMKIQQECNRIIERSEKMLNLIVNRGDTPEKLKTYEESLAQISRALGRM